MIVLLFRLLLSPYWVEDGWVGRTDTTADEAEHEGGISGDLRRNLEL
jgi:hypothetical protein